MKKLLSSAVLCLAAICFLDMPADAGEDGGAEAVESSFITISLFKNGLGFVYSEAALPGGEGRVLIRPIPEPVHGTFWLYPAGEGVSIGEARAFSREVRTSEIAGSMAEILKLNTGRTVVLELHGKTLIGTIISANENTVIFRTDGGVLALGTPGVRQVSAVEGELNMHADKTSRENVLEILAGSPSGGGRVGMNYLTGGITWAPSCSVDISDPGKARLLANAEIINEIGDLENVTIKFVSGFPNFQFSGVVSPIAMQGTLASFLNSLARPGRAPQAEVMRQVMLGERMRAVAPVVSGYAEDPEGTALEDLFFYTRDNVTLGRGERGYYPLYKMEVPYEHVYKWEIPDFIDAQDRYRHAAREEAEEEVWHSLRLTNTGNIPWTTSPAVVTRSGQVLGQDTLRYTSPGAETNLSITRAMDIKAGQEEFEISRKRAAAVFYGTHYDLVEVKGILNVSNYKDEEVVLSVSKLLSGEVTSTTHEPLVETIARGLRRVNPRNRLSWEVPVGPGGEAELEYRYQVYVRG